MDLTDGKAGCRPDRKRLLDLFGQLVSFDSPSYGEREICDFLKGRLSALGVHLWESAAVQKSGELPEKGVPQNGDPAKGTAGRPDGCGNLYGFLPGTLDQPALLLSAHMDTVEPSRGKQMTVGADGRITSAGNTVLGADDCAGLASIVEALTVISENHIPHRPVEILFSAAEEPYCAGTGQFDFSKVSAKEAYVFDLTGPVGKAAYQAPMIVSFTLRFRGRSAHAGFEPENGIHAIKAAALAVTRIPCGHVGDDAASTVNIGTISGGTADNIVPDACTVSGEIRSYSDSEAQAWMDRIAGIAEQCAEHTGAVVQIQHTVRFHAYRTDLSHPVVRRFESACRQLKIPVDLCRTFGGSDNNHLAHHGIAGLVVATAMNNCHSCGEYTTIDELERAAKLALSLILQ